MACAVVVPAVALGLTLLQEDKYSASTSLLFRDPGFSQTLFGSDFFLPNYDAARQGQTNVELISLGAISRRTARALGGTPSSKEIERSIDLQPGADADVLAIQATDPDPALAARIANTYAREFIEFRREADRQKIAQARRLVDRQIAALSAEDDDRRAESLRQRSEELRVLEALQTGNAEIVEAALPPNQPSSPRPKRNTALALVLGLLLGGGLAIFLDRADRRMRTGEEVADLLGLPLLGAIPRSSALRRGEIDRLGREGTAFQMLRTNLRYFNVDRQIRSVMVTSAAAGDGKSTVAWYLAAVDAMAGQRVLLIEADVRNPALHEIVGVGPTVGLAEVLAGQMQFEEATREIPAWAQVDESSVLTVDVLFAGRKPPNPAQLIESDRMREVLRHAEDRYDVVVVDTPPLSVVSDAIPLVAQVSGVVVVARIGKSTRNGLTALQEQLRNLGAPTLGVVVNDVAGGGDSYDGYGYGIQGKPSRSPGRRGRSRRSGAPTASDRTS